MAQDEQFSCTTGAHRDHSGRMECSRESPPSAVLTEMGRDGSRRLHVRRATAARQEKDSVSKNATGSMTTTIQTFKTLLLQGFAARSDALADLSGSPRKWGNGGTADHRTLKLSGCFAVIRFGNLCRCPHPCPLQGVAAAGCTRTTIDISSCAVLSGATKRPARRKLAADDAGRLPKSDAAFKCSAAGIGSNVIPEKNHYVRDPGMRLSAHDLITRIARRSPGGSGAFDTARISK
jgi:hypothetical protein